MKFRRSLFFSLVLLAGVAIQAAFRTIEAPAALPDDAPAADTKISVYEKDILPSSKNIASPATGNGKSKADLSFDKFKDDKSVLLDRKTWDSVQHMLQTREMPPEGRPKPEPAEIDTTLKSIRDMFHEFDRTAKLNVGRVTIRRLNRTEYNNTIRDLVGVDFKPAEDFPTDDVGYGFDNIGDVLSVSPLLLEKYLAAAEMILEQVIVIVDLAQAHEAKDQRCSGDNKFKNNPSNTCN